MNNPAKSLVPQNSTQSVIQRRQFVKYTSAAGALGAMSLAGIGSADSAEAKSEGQAVPAHGPSGKWKLSVLSYSFRGLLNAGMMDVFGYLETCKYRYGLDAADIWNGFFPSMDEGYLRKVRSALDERDMVLADLCVDQAHVWDDDGAVRDKNYANAKAHLQAAVILGAKFMRVDAGGRGTTWTDEQFDYIVKRYQEYSQLAHDHGFKVGAESHWGPETIWPNLQRLHAAVDHPGFGLSIHLGGWSGTEEQRIAWDREAAPLACHTHIAWNITEGPLAERLAPFHQANYGGYYSIEHHSGENEYRNVGIQLSRVREALAKLDAK